MLYDAAIAAMQQAKEAIENKDLETRYKKIEKTYLIISGLRDCLDVANGGEVAKTLQEWYTGTAHRVLSINSTEDVAMCDLCIKHLKEMREAWAEAKNAYEKDSENPASNDNNGEPSSFLPDLAVYFNTPKDQKQPMTLNV